MSRIAKDPVIIPEGVTINIVDNLIEFKGSKGELSLNVHNSISFEMKDNQITVKWSKNEHRAMAGTMRSLINNCVIGVSEGYTKNIKLNGVGIVQMCKEKKSP